MPLHLFFQLSLGDRPQIGQNRVQCIELVEIAVPANGRTRPPVSRVPPVIQAFPGAVGKILSVGCFRKSSRRRRDVVKHPVYPGHPWRSRVGGIGVIDNQNQTPGTLWKT